MLVGGLGEMAQLAIDRSLLQSLWNRQGGSCYYCGKPVNRREWALDYKSPPHRDGTNAVSNMAVVCRSCRLHKGDKTESEYRQWLDERKQWLDDQYRRYVVDGGARRPGQAVSAA